LTNFNVNLSGKNAIVTGGGSGIGRAIALTLAQAGAAVFVNDVNPDSIDDVADEITQAGGKAGNYHGDISNRFQASALIERAREALGAQIDIFINAAGVYRNDTLDRLDEWDWRRMLDVNLSSAFFCTQLIGRVMADGGGGCIVNLASVHALEKNLTVGVAYAASKAGLIGLTRQTALELGTAGVRVNAVSVGAVAEMDMPTLDAEALPLRRLGQPQDVANAVLFLCSDAAAFITGQTLTVDGGLALI